MSFACFYSFLLIDLLTFKEFTIRLDERCFYDSVDIFLETASSDVVILLI